MDNAGSRYGNESPRTHLCEEALAPSGGDDSPDDPQILETIAVTHGKREPAAPWSSNLHWQTASRRDLSEPIPPLAMKPLSQFRRKVWAEHFRIRAQPGQFS